MSLEEDSEKRKRRINVMIRQMEIDDLANVFHLGEELFKAEEAPNLYRTWDDYEVVELFHDDSDYCFVAEVDDEMIGFLLGTTITKSRSAWKYGHLVWLGVVPAFQRLGIAEKLFNRFRDRTVKSGVRMLLVDTDADNVAALKFFRKMGFVNPQQHIYLNLNLAAQLQLRKNELNGVSSERRSRKKDD